MRVSRSQLEDGDFNEEEEESDAEDPAADLTNGEEQPVTSDEGSDNSEGEHSHSDLDIYPPTAEDAPDVKASGGVKIDVADEGELSSTLKRAREEERKKGMAVSRQLVSSLFDLGFNIAQRCNTGDVRLPTRRKDKITKMRHLHEPAA